MLMGSAHPKNVDVDIAASIRAMGPVFNEGVLRATYDLYAPLHRAAPEAPVTVYRDIAYGQDPRHRLDLFVPDPIPAHPVPVVAYFHGGGFVAGERSPVPGLIYDNVATWFARNGMIGVNATYRLAPDNKWPSGAADVGAVVSWIGDHADEHGIDPEQVFIMGQSAGATHVAAWTFIDKIHGKSGPGIAGAILLSGSYAPLDSVYGGAAPGANQIAYYGEDLGSWHDRSPLYHVRDGHPATFIVVAEYDPYPLSWPSFALAAELVRTDRRTPWFRMLRDHNHVSPAMQIGSAVDILGDDLVDFVRHISDTGGAGSRRGAG